MESWGLHIPRLDARSHFNLTLNASAARESSWTNQNETRALIANLQLAQVQTLRTMHLTLGAFSLGLALLMVHRILSDAKRAAATQDTLRKQRFSRLRSIHPAETFPLVLACGAALQQVIFVSVQGTSLHSVLSDQCRGLAMITFPAIFLIGYVTLVFGIEMAFRAFKYERFAPRGKWNTPICMGILVFLLVLTWMPTIAWPMYNRCFGSLIWFPVRYELIAIIILGVLVALFLLLAALISIQLMRSPNVDSNERIAASRMCYYLLFASVLYTLVIPVQVQAHRRDFMNTLASSRVAEVALFSSGIAFSFFHSFLRVNATRLVIEPIGSPNKQQKRPRIRFFGPSDLEMTISGPMALQGGRRPDSRQGLIDVGPEKNHYDFEPDYFTRPERPLSPGSIRSNGSIDPSKWPLPPHPVQIGYFDEQPKDEASVGLHKRNKSNYSLFPTRAEDVPRLPATVYTPPEQGGESRFSKLSMRRQLRRSSFGGKSVTDVSEAFSFLTKPAPLFAKSHRRDESSDSSATVQIGLRFSVAPATLAAAKYTKAEREVGASPLRRQETDSSRESLRLSIPSPSTNQFPGSPLAFPEPPRRSESPAFSEPSQRSESPAFSEPSQRSESPAFPKPSQRSESPTKLSPGPGKTPAFPILSSSAYLQSQREKVLPATPRSNLPGPPPTAQAPAPLNAALSGLRMNPVSPASIDSPSTPGTPVTPTTPPRSIRSQSPSDLSPAARIPLGAGTMARSPPKNGWI